EGREPQHEAPGERDRHPDHETDLEGHAALAEDGHRVRAEGHEGRVAEGDLSRVPERQVETDGQDRVDERQAQDVELVLIEDRGRITPSARAAPSASPRRAQAPSVTTPTPPSRPRCPRA